MAKKPAIIATMAATPLFLTKEVAAEEGVDEALAVLAAAEFVGTETVDGVGLLEAPEVAGVALEPEVAGMALEAPDDEGDEDPLLVELEPAELAGVVNGTGLGVALGPVGARLAIEEKGIRSLALKIMAKI